MFSRHLIESAALENAGLDLAVRLNWYRSLPLSCVEILEVHLDGVPLPRDRTTLDLDGECRPVADLAGLDDRWWHVLDTARVRVGLDLPPGAGRHDVEVVIGTRIPYLVAPDGQAVVISDRAHASVTA